MSSILDGRGPSPAKTNEIVAQLPNGACRERCQFPELPRATGHHCPGCKLAIHAVCGVHDEKGGLDDSTWCYDCWDSKMQDQKMPARKISVPSRQPRKSTSRAKTPARKTSVVPSRQPRKSTSRAKRNVGSRMYLFGIILRRDKFTTTACTYRVEWEHTALGETVIDINVLQPAIELARKLQNILDDESKHPLGADVLHFLRANDGSTPGAAIPSDDEEGKGKESEEDDDQDDDNERDNVDDISINFAYHSLQTKRGGQPTTQQDGLLWATNTASSPDIGIYDQTKGSTIKAEMQSRFTNPLSSFLAFLPLEFWKLFVFETNRFAASRQAEATLVEGPAVNWASRLTLKELFTFLGILIQMTMRPTPGQTYTNCWQDKRWHPYTDRMPLRRFQAIRGMLHMTEKGFPEESSNDALYKVRPLLNVLKKTLGDYLIPGSDLALDETSVACRSKYGRNLIFYNNTKPSGKYHFRFYALCDSDSYAICGIQG